MCPINMIPQIGAVEMSQKDRISKNNLSGSEKTVPTANKANDTFTKSDLLNSIESIVTNDKMSATQSKKIAELKQKISNNELGIQSNDAGERLSAARNIAKKWLAFEQQLQLETTKE